MLTSLLFPGFPGPRILQTWRSETSPFLGSDHFCNTSSTTFIQGSWEKKTGQLDAICWDLRGVSQFGSAHALRIQQNQDIFGDTRNYVTHDIYHIILYYILYIYDISYYHNIEIWWHWWSIDDQNLTIWQRQFMHCYRLIQSLQTVNAASSHWQNFKDLATSAAGWVTGSTSILQRVVFEPLRHPLGGSMYIRSYIYIYIDIHIYTYADIDYPKDLRK